MEKRSYLKEFTKGIVKENPVLCLVLGTCPTLAITTAAMNGLGMGAAATAGVLFGCNLSFARRLRRGRREQAILRCSMRGRVRGNLFF